MTERQKVESVQLFNTMTRQVDVFKPIEEGKVRLYTCGPTVYSYAHIGNMRAYIFADTLKRTLQSAGYGVNHVMNITDVGHLTSDADEGEDKMLVGMQREGLTAWEIAKKYTEAFLKHAEMLNIKPPTTRSNATDYICEQVGLVETLEKKGYTYVTDDGVYFDTSKVNDYGRLAKLDISGLREGERVSVGCKHHKTDFALWKFSPKNAKRDMEWNSPWGVGFPGWHIECSAMAMTLLGETIDIHTGGIDHIPVHHTNEIAQSECASGKTFANFWMHSEFLTLVGEEKMSKSKGGVLTVDTLVEQGFEPLAYRYLVLTSHYRSHMQYSAQIMQAAATAYRRLKQQVLEFKAFAGGNAKVNGTDAYNDYRKGITAHLFNDLNTAAAIASLRQAFGDKTLGADEKYALAVEIDEVLGLELDKEVQVSLEVPQRVLDLVSQREAARQAKDWKRSDELRREISALGFSVKDSSEGPVIEKA